MTLFHLFPKNCDAKSICKRNENICPQKNLYVNVYTSIIPECLWWMHKQNMVYLPNIQTQQEEWLFFLPLPDISHYLLQKKDQECNHTPNTPFHKIMSVSQTHSDSKETIIYQLISVSHPFILPGNNLLLLNRLSLLPQPHKLFYQDPSPDSFCNLKMVLLM